MNILVLDIGSSSARAIIFDQHANKIPGAEASIPYQFNTQPQGASTIDIEVLRQAVETCIDMVLQHPEAGHIQAVGMATFVGNVLGVDKQNRPVTPVYTYADTRCVESVSWLKQQINISASHQRTGCMLHTAYLPGRLHWLKTTQRELYDKVVQWVDVGTYMYRCWFGKNDTPCSYSVASWSGLLHREDLSWDTHWLKLLGISEESFPPLADYDTPSTYLVNDYANRWGILSPLPFYLTVGDGACANVGSGCIEQDRIALTIGTTAALRIAGTTPPPQVPQGLWSYRVSRDIHLTGGATSEGGNIYTWIRETFKLPSFEEVEQYLINCEPASHGLTFIPLLAGERSPGWNAEASGTIHGLRLSTTPQDILMAALEGIAMRLAIISDQLNQIATESASVIASGGALLKSYAWQQIIANTMNRQILVADESEITARGVAILALKASGKAIQILPTIRHVVEPDSKHAEKLRAARQNQQHIYSVLYGQSPLEKFDL